MNKDIAIKQLLTPAQVLAEQNTITLARELFVQGKGNISDTELMVFLRSAANMGLNPYMGEIGLYPFGGGGKLLTYVTKQGAVKIARRDPSFNGYETGIITDGMTYREGSLLFKGECLFGAWARVYIKNVLKPVYKTVSKDDPSWRKWEGNKFVSTAEMAIKTALKRALQEAFPEVFPAHFIIEGEYPQDQTETGQKTQNYPEVSNYTKKGEKLKEKVNAVEQSVKKEIEKPKIKPTQKKKKAEACVNRILYNELAKQDMDLAKEIVQARVPESDEDWQECCNVFQKEMQRRKEVEPKRAQDVDKDGNVLSFKEMFKNFTRKHPGIRNKAVAIAAKISNDAVDKDWELAYGELFDFYQEKVTKGGE